MTKLPRAEWVLALAWIEDLAAPGFNWDLRKISELTESVECWVEGDSCVFVQNIGATAELLLLATSPSGRRKGGMRALLTALFGQLSQYQDWWLEVHENNFAARELYTQLGFHVTGRRARYYSDGGGAILMNRLRPL